MASIENLLRDVSMRGTKAEVEDFSATMEESALAYATDTEELGIYTNGAWVWLSAGLSGGGTSKTLQTYTILHQETLAGTGRFDVAGISQDYDHLIIRCQLRSTQATDNDFANMIFNNDTTATNYHNQSIGGRDAAAFQGESDTPIFTSIPGSSSGADDFQSVEVQIYNYADAKRKEAFSLGGSRQAIGISLIRAMALNWESTAAINRITIQPDGYATDEFAAGSYLEIIGVREEAVGGATYSAADVSNPPTDAELDAEFGTPATVGAGFLAVVDDAGAGTNEYLAWSDGTNWFYATGTKAT